MTYDGPALAQGKVWDQLVDIFGSDAVSALANIKELIIGGPALLGLFQLVKRLRGKNVTARDDDPASGRIRLTLNDGTSVEVASEVLDLYRNIEVRRRARQVVEPLTRDGMNAVEFRSHEAVTLRIERDDVPAFDLPPSEYVPLLDRESEMVVAIAAVAFHEGNKWRLTDGERTFWAAIEDQEFLQRVDHGIESFRKGDMLECRLRVVQSQSDEGLHTEYSVLKVIRHIPRTLQLSLGESAPPPRSGDTGPYDNPGPHRFGDDDEPLVERPEDRTRE